MKILFASSNPHKLEEIQAIWSAKQRTETTVPIELISLARVDPGKTIPEPVEDQPTFEANAAVKARYWAWVAGMPSIADDSGLEVDALGGRPGVRSARFAGVSGPRGAVDQANNECLLRELAGVGASERTARFVCAMVLCTPGGSTPRRSPNGLARHDPSLIPPADAVRLVTTVRGTVEGRVIGDHEQPRGDGGFGYDPLFFVPALGKTTAELSPSEKNAISHRGVAAGLMWDRLQALGADPLAW